jgi:alkylhydroperoxidase family enzyme
MERVTRAILDTPGDLDPAVRLAAEAYAANIATPGARPAATLPAELVPYVDKVARHAYEVGDEDIDALRRAGYSEDAVFELTLATALGAARARLERGLAVLHGER